MSSPIDRIEDDNDLPPSDDLRAGEYVLGVLDAQSRVQAQARIASDHSFAALVAQWEDRFSAWMTRAEPVAPSAHVWPRIRSELGWNAVASSPTGLWNSVGFWRGATALAAAASVAAIVFGLRGAAPVPLPPQVVVQLPTPQVPPQTEEAVARPVTVLATDDGATGWIARIDASGGKVLMVPVPRPADPSGKVDELWVIPAGQAPISLGFVSNEKAHSIDVPASVRTALIAGSTLAVTLEAQEGMPHSAPAGPIVAKGAIVTI
ncbi:anti-sigma factor [Thermomonas sp.]|uniref:anti-sigma factor n=1 Tax=Thermomonas sp. TaxID=1971895 RepID=UPI00248A25D8|nr:anti-sigma factor [Thermomonas sp.]MDI1253402.1 anti-sigma factor [Thermomonas sp.]